MARPAPRILIKASNAAGISAFQLGGTPFHLAPLFPGAAPASGAVGFATPAQWHIAEMPSDWDEAHIWDVCHNCRVKDSE